MLTIRKQPRKPDTLAERESRAAARQAHREIKLDRMVEDSVIDLCEIIKRESYGKEYAA